MGTYQKKNTETIVLQPNLVGEKKRFFFFCGSFFGWNLTLKKFDPHGNYEQKTKTNENPQYWSKGGIMGTYQKNFTETWILKPIMHGDKKKKILNFQIWKQIFFQILPNFTIRTVHGNS